MVTVVATVLMSFGLQLSFSNGRAEVVLYLVGPMSRTVRRELSLLDNSVSFHIFDKMYVLNFVDSYKHLGSQFSVSCDLKMEVVSKAGYIKSGLKAIAPVLKHPKVDLKRKVIMISSHLLAGGLHHCGAWGRLPYNVYVKLFHAILHAYRMATHNVYDPAKIQDIFSDRDLIQEFGFVAPASLIRCSRLLLFNRLVRKAPQYPDQSAPIQTGTVPNLAVSHKQRNYLHLTMHLWPYHPENEVYEVL